MNILKKLSYLLIVVVLIASCKDDDDNADQQMQPLGDYEHGILITNEGPFGSGTGTVSFISNDLSTEVSSVFNIENGSDLGNIVNSMGFNEEFGYIVVNNSHKISVVNRYTFEELAIIDTGLNNPRHFVAVGDTGYVSNWGDPNVSTDDYIAVIDLLTNTITSNIPVVLGPERMVTTNNKVYVAHQGAYGQNNQISVIDATTNAVLNQITIGDVPNSMVLNGTDLWVLCGGSPSFTGAETGGSLYRINTSDNTLLTSLDFQDIEHPGLLSVDGTSLYYALNGGVFKMDMSDSTLPSNSIITGFFYAMIAKNGMLYATDAGDFASNGTLTLFDLLTNTEVDSFTVGIIPGGIYFNE
ncbi:YncE family protein [Ulvibacter antarcticus]|uniref:YVTN family beta-propeller protein n=1 Tax=Ulvibacter antarcticus TaxID=442714 RepID=A0A3L9YXR9_9FLAO|nr:DUF5074 domain-containing protein [Ulvibacter antarcticus]RMA64627.1 YVTN family beta-propeller protein [Ulvibacter antarcticus]